MTVDCLTTSRSVKSPPPTTKVLEDSKVGLKISKDKITEFIRINNNQDLSIQLKGEDKRETNQINSRRAYLGSVKDKDGGADDKKRLNKASFGIAQRW